MRRKRLFSLAALLGLGAIALAASGCSRSEALEVTYYYLPG